MEYLKKYKRIIKENNYLLKDSYFITRIINDKIINITYSIYYLEDEIIFEIYISDDNIIEIVQKRHIQDYSIRHNITFNETITSNVDKIINWYIDR